MTPLQVGVILGILLTSFTTIYYFMIPDTIKTSVRNSVISIEGFWGKPNSEFNWCEPDYTVTLYIAEPFNTISSLFYNLATVFALSFHTTHTIERSFYFLIALVCCVGFGSVAFHATLLYKMQLLDELPMHWLVTTTTFILWRRSTGLRKFDVLTLLCAEALMSILMWNTPRESTLHEFSRAYMILTFSLCFVYVFVGCAQAAQEIDKALTMLENSSSHQDRQNDRGRKLFGRTFLIWMLGLVSWISDIMFCPLLHQLPIPYPQLHFFWHFFSALGIYHVATVLFMHQKVMAGQLAKVDWFWGIPYITLKKSIR